MHNLTSTATAATFEHMELGTILKQAREVKGLSQKEVAAAAEMDQAQYSRIENGKTDPSFSLVVRIAQAMRMELHELFKPEGGMKEVVSADKSMLEKLALIDGLDKKEKQAFYTILDALIAKKQIKDTLAAALK